MNTSWSKRAEKYDELEWVQNQVYLKAFVEAGNFQDTDIVLDIGTGTGVVAKAIAPLVAAVVGLDKSRSMLSHTDSVKNINFIQKDIRNSKLEGKKYTKVTARHVFRHITEETQRAMDECYRLLKEGGVIVLSEGVPPSPGVKQDYIEIFKLKGNRLVFLEENLIRLMSTSGFKDINLDTLWLRQMSIRNWLTNSGLSKPTQEKIFKLHIDGSRTFKEAYNLKEKEGDCLIDMKMVILTGRK